jgi:predicted nucleic acid-binding protein
MVFVDTCVLIDYSRGRLEINETNYGNYCINSIVQMEFIAGALDKRELKKINKILSRFVLLEIDQEILNVSAGLMNRYTLSHGMSVYDAIIAATCMVYDLPLWTYNEKDFRFLDVDLRHLP